MDFQAPLGELRKKGRRGDEATGCLLNQEKISLKATKEQKKRECVLKGEDKSYILFLNPFDSLESPCFVAGKEHCSKGTQSVPLG